MGKFETKGQVAGLFLGAAGVAFILILLVNAEVNIYLSIYITIYLSIYLNI